MGPRTRVDRDNLFRKARVMLLAFTSAYWRGTAALPIHQHRGCLRLRGPSHGGPHLGHAPPARLGGALLIGGGLPDALRGGLVVP